MSDHASTPDGDHEHGFAHPMPGSMLIGTFLALVALTVLTVLLAGAPVGEWEMVISMGIATIKAALVVFIFMHLLYDRLFNGIIFFFSLAFVALFMVPTLYDVWVYQDGREEAAMRTTPVAGEAAAPAEAAEENGDGASSSLSAWAEQLLPLAVSVAGVIVACGMFGYLLIVIHAATSEQFAGHRRTLWIAPVAIGALLATAVSVGLVFAGQAESVSVLGRYLRLGGGMLAAVLGVVVYLVVVQRMDESGTSVETA